MKVAYIKNRKYSDLHKNKENGKMVKYLYPSIECLKNTIQHTKYTDKKLYETALKLESIFRYLNIECNVVSANSGKFICTYEVKLRKAEYVRKIQRKKEEIKELLNVEKIEIEAPVDWTKSTLKLMVLEEDNSPIFLKEILLEYAGKKWLEFSIGKNVYGENVWIDYTEKYSWLIAGMTGTGKSMFVHSFILSLLYRVTPEAVKIIIIDTNSVEYNLYNSIPHMLLPVITDWKKAIGVMEWCILEMNERYEKMLRYNIKEIEHFNAWIENNSAMGLNKFPHIFIIIDDYYGISKNAKNEMETRICKVAQKGGKAGIHLMLVTQRASAEIVGSSIKENIPNRIAFSVESAIDSRMILEENGAEKLRKNGAMILKNMISKKKEQLQGIFVSEEEITEVVSDVIEKCTVLN